MRGVGGCGVGGWVASVVVMSGLLGASGMFAVASPVSVVVSPVSGLC